MPFIPLQCNLPLQAVAVQIFLGHLYTLCSLYLPPGATVDKRDLVNLVSNISSPFLLLWDFDGRHHLCFGVTINPRGVLISSFIEDEAIDILILGFS